MRCVAGQAERTDPSGQHWYARAVVSAPTISYELVAPALRAAKALGIQKEAVFSRADVRVPEATGPAARLPLADAYAVWRAAETLAAKPGFGLYAASLFESGDMDLLEYVVRSGKTLEDAFAVLDEFYRLAHDVGRFAVREEGGVLYITADAPPHFMPPPPMAEWALAAWAGMMQQDFGPISLVGVWFVHPRQKGTTQREYERVLGCPVRFGAPENAILAHPAVLSLPNKRADQKLRDVLEPVAKERVRALPKNGSLADRIHAEVLAVLPDKDPSMLRMSRALGMSERTLRRRLAEEGTTFAAIVDDVRRELVLSALKDEHAGIEEAALKAGFSDGTALHRAFRRWTGTTPQAYRRSQGSVA